LIDKRLQDKLRKETDTVRRAEEAKKDKHIANRKEEEIQLKNSIVGPSCVSFGTAEINKTRDDTSIGSVVRDFPSSPISFSHQI